MFQKLHPVGKKYCGAPGGPISAIFATITLDPLYFEVHIFSDPLDPPYMSKNAKMCYFEHFFGVRWKKPYLNNLSLDQIQMQMQIFQKLSQCDICDQRTRPGQMPA